MNAERHITGCGHQGDELVRLACGDTPAPSESLQAHLRECAACRDELTSLRGLVGYLRVALKPEPITNSLRERICCRLDVVASRGYRVSEWIRLGAASAVVAACIALTIMFPHSFGSLTQSSAADSAGELALSKADVAAIAAAYAVLRWDDPVEYGLESLAERAEDVVQSVERKLEGRSGLPWNAQDDWDTPIGTQESARPSPVAPLCSHDCGTAAGSARAA